MKRTTVINLFGGPGTGKSTTAAGVFVLAKTSSVNWAFPKVELITEYAKDLTYARSFDQLSDSLYVLAKQHNRMRRCARNELDLLITDSPLLFSSVYARDYDFQWFHDAVRALHESYENFNVVLDRVKPYARYGRSQTEHEARGIDDRIKEFLEDNQIPVHLRLPADENAAFEIWKEVLARNPSVRTENA